MTDPTRPLGDLGNQQRYSEAEVERVARAARQDVTGEKDAGKVYCPFCQLREARWRRSFREGDRTKVDLFVYCTQCHKTGVTVIDLAASPGGGMRRAIRSLWAWLTHS